MPIIYYNQRVKLSIGDDTMYKISEFAKLIGRSQATLRNWHKSGILIPFKVINKYRYYSQAQLEEYTIDKSSDIVV